MYVIPIIEMVIDAITQNLTKSIWGMLTGESQENPGRLEDCVMNDEDFLRAGNKLLPVKKL